MTPRAVFVLYEHGNDPRPYGPSYIRLLRPLTHPSVRNQITATWGQRYEDQPVEAVIIDRLWRHDLSLVMAQNVVQDIHRAGARFLYALDDDFLSLPVTGAGYFTAEKRRAVEYWLRTADGVLVTTPFLRERLNAHTAHCVVVPNALDERLLIGGSLRPIETVYGRRRVVIGYMGTLTHEADWRLILPAWRSLHQQYPNGIEFQVVGVADQAQALAERAGVPVRILQLPPDETEYPQFMLWFTQHAQWDIAVAPLLDTPFTRCKSDLKFLDYSSLGAATIASRGPVYEGSVQHGQTGWLAENTVESWVQALETLVVNDELRITLARNAAHYVLTERTLMHCAHRWTSALTDLLERP
ncbi:MAG TPA: glycosyltransferase [Anaerolineae bacterium]|nr:glycosyltransferase [Anaerolineae bacterium]